MSSFQCDVLVVGGGPGGSTVGALLAERGHDVVVMEKARHPRFHIGESLLPANGALFRKLGVLDEVERIGMSKWGVEFVSPEHAQPAYIELAEALDKSMPGAWQVRRSELDELLFRNAERKGARTLGGCRVRNVAFDAEGATAQVERADGASELWRARFLVDASGRDTLLANQLTCKVKNRRPDSAALFGHFTGARLEGNIPIFWWEHGWFWFIPLADGTTSVGAVCWPYYLKSRRGQPLADFLHATIALCPALAERLDGAVLVEGSARATGNDADRSSRSGGDRFLMIGDAFGVIDPVFSSGVFLAMQSAFGAADVVDKTLARPAAAGIARRRFVRRMRFGLDQFSWFIFRVTNPTMREFFMASAAPFRVKEALISLLAGDIYGTTPIWRGVRTLKALYDLVSLRHLSRTWRARLRRRENIRAVGDGAVV